MHVYDHETFQLWLRIQLRLEYASYSGLDNLDLVSITFLIMQFMNAQLHILL